MADVCVNPSALCRASVEQRWGRHHLLWNDKSKWSCCLRTVLLRFNRKWGSEPPMSCSIGANCWSCLCDSSVSIKSRTSWRMVLIWGMEENPSHSRRTGGPQAGSRKPIDRKQNCSARTRDAVKRVKAERRGTTSTDPAGSPDRAENTLLRSWCW